ncbi:MAG: hydrogenase maturation protease [Planctomycetes bacterium]|nr:hydrogenase maturation protease [Planctomycetota bacterium]
MSPAPILIVGIGNPSRGDDALGPEFVERVGTALADEIAAGRIELLTDFQLQVEHMLDLTGRRRVVFVDASESAEPPFEFTPIEARRDASHSSHVLSPAALLDAHRTVVGEPPEAWLLALRGERFELGEPLSPRARASLAAAVDSFVRVIRADEGPQSPS